MDAHKIASHRPDLTVRLGVSLPRGPRTLMQRSVPSAKRGLSCRHTT